jgi:hypothetical protein
MNDGPTGRRLTPEQVASLVAVTEPWLSCDDCFDTLDLWVDALIDGVPRRDQPLLVHFARCAACREEVETLLTLAAQEHGIEAEGLLERLGSLIDEPRTEPVVPAPGRRNLLAWARRLRRG